MNKPLLFAVCGILVVVIAGGGLWYKEKKDQELYDRASMYLEGAKLETEAKEKLLQERKSCIDEAYKEYAATFELNSNPAPQKDYPDARLWDSAEIRESTENKYQKDKEFCLELYK